MPDRAQILDNRLKAGKPVGPARLVMGNQATSHDRDCFVVMTGRGPGAHEAIVQNKANLDRGELTLTLAVKRGYEGRSHNVGR